MSIDKKNYLDEISSRKKESRVYRKFQHTGLAIAELLNDLKHKSIYIKLASQFDNERLLQIAKDVAERKNVANKGAYFMKVFQKNKINITKIRNNTKVRNDR